jgi:hypothetical protein
VRDQDLEDWAGRSGGWQRNHADGTGIAAGPNWITETFDAKKTGPDESDPELQLL